MRERAIEIPRGWAIKKPNRNVSIGFGSSLPAFGAMDLRIVPKVSFIPTRLVIPRGIAEDFYITDIVCKHSSLSSVMYGAFPALIYSEGSDIDLDVGLCPEGEDITLKIECVSPVARKIGGMITGIEMVKEEREAKNRCFSTYRRTMCIRPAGHHGRHFESYADGEEWDD